MSRTVSETFKDLRERGEENVFQRFRGFYQAIQKKCDDPLAMGRGTIHADTLGFPQPHPDFADTFSPYAGDDFGFFFPHYEEDLVYVTFDHGDVSSPMIVGGFWKTRDDKKLDKTGLPAEFVIEGEKDENGEVTAAAPSVRGIKVRNGSALVFDETTDLGRVEMWSGETQGIGKRAVKHHRVRLDDTKDKGQVVVATFGDKNNDAEEAADTDTPDVRDKKELEGRLRHQVTMRDTTDDRFVEVKTIGTDAMMKFHKVLMSDTDEKITLTSSDQHFIQISDKDDNVIVETLAKFRTIWDEKNKNIITETPGLQKITMDDNATSITIETATKQQIIQDLAGTLINEPAAKFDVIATTASTHTYAAAMTRTIGGALTDTIGAAMTLTIAQALTVLVGQATTWTGQAFTWMGTNFTFLGTQFAATVAQATITAAQVTIAAPNVLAGTGANQPLVNLLGSIKFNAHTHIVTGPFPGFAIPTTESMIPGVDTTVALLGA